MPGLPSCFGSTNLIVLAADSREAAVQHVLESRPDSVPVCSWSSQTQVTAVEPKTGLEKLLAPVQPAKKLSEALKAFQRLKQPAILVVFDLERVDNETSLVGPLRVQHAAEADGRPVETWIVLVVTTPAQRDLITRLARELDLDFAPMTAEVPSLEPSSAPVRRSTQSAAKLDLSQIKQRDSFDTPEWTDRLNHLPFAQLKQIVETPGLVDAVAGRVARLQSSLKKALYGKDEIIDLMTWCSVAHLPLMLLGTWGTGKSMLVRAFSRGLGIGSHKRSINSEDELIAELEKDLAAQPGEVKLRKGRQRILSQMAGQHFGRHFEYLVTRFTTPEELLGPVNIDLMLSQSIYLRQTQSLLPRAEIAFLDEVFKANSSILNALLSLINERLFYNAGLPWTVNMVMLFGASNEPPQEEDLGAFYDRFPVRVLCDSVPNDQLDALLERSQYHQFLSLTENAADLDEARKVFPQPTAGQPAGGKPPSVKPLDWHEARITPTACVNDFRLLNKVILYRFGGPYVSTGSDSARQFLATFNQMLRSLRDQYDISDRSVGHFYRLARARAILSDRTELNRSDCGVLRFVGKTVDELRQLTPIVHEFVR